MAARQKGEKDLCVYAAEVGDHGVNDGVINILTQCTQDKIFSANEDMLCVTRDDQMFDLHFSELNWELLRKIESEFREPPESDWKSDPVSTLSTICESIEAQAVEDSYQNKKILFFGNFLAPLNESRLAQLGAVIEETNILVTIVTPDKKDLTQTQEANVDLLRRTFENHNTVYVSYLKEATKVLANTLSKKPTRPTPWNISMEIGPSLRIDVQSFVLNRKNTSTELKTALEKNVLKLAKPKIIPINGEPASSSMALAFTGQAGSQGNELVRSVGSYNESEKPDLVYASKTVKRETTWRQDDGTVVDDDQIIEAYMYGERLVPFDETDQQNAYKSGEKCFRILVFCPRENIKPCYMLGNGMDLILPKKVPDAEVKFDAFLKALHNTKRVALVRKVRVSNSRLVLGVIAPCLERKGLIFTEVCFGDDISTPYFTPLIKPEELAELEDGMNEKDSLMDELIMSRALDFTPSKGPVDPAIQVLRDNITRKILGKPISSPVKSIISGSNQLAVTGSEPEPTSRDNIELYFESIVLRDEVATKLKEVFPIKQVYEKKQEEKEKVVVVRKREPSLEAIKAEAEATKRIKLDEEPLELIPALPSVTRDEFDADFLVDNE